jgi:predicted DNA-binding protein
MDQTDGATHALSIRLPLDLHEDLAALAHLNRGSVASEVREAVKLHLQVHLNDGKLMKKVEAEIASLNRLRARYGHEGDLPLARRGVEDGSMEPSEAAR